MARGICVCNLLLLVGCGSPASVQLGGFTVDLEGGAPFAIKSGGLVLSASDTRTFGFRQARASYEHQFGAFKIEETPLSDWITASALTDVEADDAQLTATLIDEGDSPIGRLTIRPVGASLSIAIAPENVELDRAFVSLDCDDGGGFLGFGAQTHDVDHRGQIVPIFVSEQGIGKIETDELPEVWFLTGTRHQSYLPVPTMLAPRADASYGLHATTNHRSIWDLCKTDSARLEIQVWERQLELYVAPGPSPLAVVEQQTAINGRIQTAPDWTFGVWMESVGGTAAVLAEAAALRAAEIPASAIWSEDWRGGKIDGNNYILEEDWRADPILYPGLASLIEQLHAAGYKWMTYFNTFVGEGVDVEAEIEPHLVRDRLGERYLFKGADFNDTGLADLFVEANRAFVRTELENALELGVDGWMADFAEWYPADPTTVMVSDGSDAEAAHNRYPLEWAKVNREAVERTGKSDAVIFHRSGYSGAQGVAQVIWAGDQRTSFQPDDGLPTVVPIIVGLGATGFSVVTHDIGGYVSETNPPTTKDLFFRWTTLGALGPVMRTHHGRSAASNWRWNSDVQTIAHFKRWADFHTKLYPFYMGLGLDARDTGAPIQRPMAFADPGDRRLHGVKDQYLLGDAVLVAPVLTASTARRPVVLPKGLWYALGTEDIASSIAHEGGGSIEIDVPLSEIGLLARAGAVVPVLRAPIQSLISSSATLDLHDDPSVEVWVWLGADGRATGGEGVRYIVESAARPRGPLSIEGQGAVTEPTSARFDGPAGGTTLLDAGGGRHKVRAEGLPSGTVVHWYLRW